jgi:hypothetical protein
MSDALSLALSASFVAAAQPPAVAPSPAPAPAPESHSHINVNAPVFISPSITFDPVTNVVIFTYRNAESGKVTHQFPPSAVVSRYREVDETGLPKPALPVSTKATVAATQRPSNGTPTTPTPQPSLPSTDGSGSPAATPGSPSSSTIA